MPDAVILEQQQCGKVWIFGDLKPISRASKGPLSQQQEASMRVGRLICAPGHLWGWWGCVVATFKKIYFSLLMRDTSHIAAQ